MSTYASAPNGEAVHFDPRPGFKTEIHVEPGHAIRLTRGNGSNYGVTSMKLRLLLHGPHATMQYLFSTGLIPESDGTHWTYKAPSGYDVGYHADAPQWDGQEQNECDYRPSGGCYFDGSGLTAITYEAILLMDGHGGVFRALQAYYDETEWVES